MTAEEAPAHRDSQSGVLLSRENIWAYVKVTLGIVLIVAFYHILLGPARAGPPDGRRPPSGSPRPPPAGDSSRAFNSWPLWGQLVIPSPPEIVVALVVSAVAVIGLVYLHRRGRISLSPWLAAAVGMISIIATSLIHGWEIGIVQPIGGPIEIFNDAVRVRSVIDFISNYETLQPTLTVHAQTHPPGAVLVIYVLCLAFGSPGMIALGICVISSAGSAVFLKGLVRQLFDEDIAGYAALLYLFLPAVQAYYLANIYAIVATLVLGLTYFYLHPDRRVAFAGSLVCLFLLTFITFLSAFAVLFLFAFETLKALAGTRDGAIVSRVVEVLRSIRLPLLLSACIAAAYALLSLATGFNYINAFLYASSLENPNGLTLLANPIEYVVTRVEDVMDIMIFFGPILSVLAYRGLLMMRDEAGRDGRGLKRYALVVAALISLAILFLAGTPKKGETARICMFILPFLLIPVLTYITGTGMSTKERAMLLGFVFGQAVLLQLFGLWVW